MRRRYPPVGPRTTTAATCAEVPTGKVPVMTTPEPDGPLDELLDVEDAAAVLEVPPEQVLAMADQGLLTPEEGSSGPRFRRDELLAVRLQGG
jgi:hypothetical protein